MIFFSDQFIGDTGTLLQNHTPNKGVSWTVVWQTAAGEDFQINGSKQCVQAGDVGGSTGVIYSADITYQGSDYYILCDQINTPDTDSYLFVRQTDVDNMYAVRLISGASASQLYKKVSGTWTALGSAFTADSGSRSLKLEIIGSTLTFYSDGVSMATATDSDLTATGKAGIGGGGGSELVNAAGNLNGLWAIDNFTVNTIGADANFQINKLRPAIFTPGVAR